jgi:hypothetical protein
MPGERLYDLALQFKNSKLWKQLSDTELFALELLNGETGYCCVMGELGEHIALALYIGRDGLDSYRNMFEAQDAPTTMLECELMFSQDCVQCSFENKDELSPQEIGEATKYAKARGINFRGRKAFPQFQRFRPAHYPWRLTDQEDEQLLFEALSAALQVAEMLGKTNKHSLGFLDGPPYNRSIPFLKRSSGGYTLSKTDLPARQEYVYPSPPVRDELLLARLKNKKKTKKTWACEVVMLPSPMSEEEAGEDGMVEAPESAPFFPFMLLIADCMSETIISGEIVSDYDRDAEKLVTALAQAMSEHGVPSEIQVRDKRTELLLGTFAKQSGLKLVRRSSLPLLDDIEEDMLAHFDVGMNETEDDIEQMFEVLMQMDDQEFRSMPPELRRQLLDLELQGALPEPVAARVRRIFG